MRFRTAILVVVGTFSCSSPALATFECPVTLPNGVAAVEPSRDSYGTPKLSTLLWPKGTVVFSPGGSGFRTPDEALGMKFPWWRGERVRGYLRIEGRRIDGDAPPLRSEFTDYGDRGFQATYVIFPTPGCWEVTGRAGEASITFITEVIKIGDGPAWRRDPVYRR